MERKSLSAEQEMERDFCCLLTAIRDEKNIKTKPNRSISSKLKTCVNTLRPDRRKKQSLENCNDPMAGAYYDRTGKSGDAPILGQVKRNVEGYQLIRNLRYYDPNRNIVQPLQVPNPGWRHECNRRQGARFIPNLTSTPRPENYYLEDHNDSCAPINPIRKKTGSTNRNNYIRPTDYSLCEN